MYTLDANHIPHPCMDTLEWGSWMESADRRVDLTSGDGWSVSTVFLSLDHSFSGDPILFETMVFWDGETGEIARYYTWAEATAGHERIASMLALEANQAHQRSLAVLAEIIRTSIGNNNE